MFAKQIWKLKKKFRNIIKRLFYMFGYSIRTVQKLSFSTMAPIKQKVKFLEKDSYILDFKKVDLDGDIYFLPKYAENYIPIKRDTFDKTLYGTLIEPATHKFIANMFAHFKGSMIHAGAFCGDMLPSFSKSVNGFVYAFEPVLENFIMSKQTVMQNNLQNVFLFNAALGNKVENLHINTSIGQWHRGESSKIDKIGDLCMSLTIDAFTYSSLILIQLDIEGFELNALQGAEKTIKQHRPIIAIEDNKLNCSEFLGSCDYISPMAIPGLDIWVHKDQTDYLEKLKNIKL